MFTGIVQAVGAIERIDSTKEGAQFRISVQPSFVKDLSIGASVCVDGVCLSVVERGDSHMLFDAVSHTLSVTNLNDRRVGDPVNLERSARFGDEIGGHLVSGHVSTTATITSIELNSSDNHIEFVVDPAWAQYVFLRGFLAVDGASLTVAKYDETARLARIALIPETIRATAFRRYKVGDRINLEIESQTKVLVDIVSTSIRRALNQVK